jgi:hypothetical protein
MKLVVKEPSENRKRRQLFPTPILVHKKSHLRKLYASSHNSLAHATISNCPQIFQKD